MTASTNTVMAPKDTGDSQLPTIYLQIEYADSPFTTLGVGADSTEADIRDAYRALALRIHPDKAPLDSLRELHTSLFQKVQAAYDDLLRNHLGQSPDDTFAGPKRLPETLASLHARNVSFQEALRSERQRALKAKHAADARKAAAQANIIAKNERLVERREAYAQRLERERETKAKQIAKRCKHLTKSLEVSAEKNGEGAEALRDAAEQPLLDWEQEEDRLEADAEHKKAVAAKAKHGSSASKSERPARNTPTAATARPMWDNAVDERLVSGAEINGRWDKKLLSGGGSGSVSLSQKKQKEHSAAAIMHKYTMALCEEADDMLKPALINKTGNHTFSGLVEEEVMDEAFVGVEAYAEVRTEQVMRLMDKDVVEQYLLEDGDLVLRVALGSLAIKEK